MNVIRISWRVIRPGSGAAVARRAMSKPSSTRADRGFDFVESLGRRTRLLQIQRPDLGQADASAGAVEQPRGQSLLEMHDVLARHRGGNAQPGGGCSETAQLRHSDEDSEADQRIHMIINYQEMLALQSSN